MTKQEADEILEEIDQERAAKRSLLLTLNRTDPSMPAEEARVRIASIVKVRAVLVETPGDN